MAGGDPLATLHIAVAGRGDDAARWLRALRGSEGATAEAVALNASDDLLQALAREEVAAIAFSGAMDDLAGAIKRSLMASRHVLVVGPSALASKTLLALDALARRRGRVLLFDSEAMGDQRVAFVRKTIVGPRALWRPRYLRSLRAGPQSGATLDALAIADIGFAMSLLGTLPARVSALSPRLDDESGTADVAMIMLTFDGGPSARIDVSLIEPEPRREVTAVCDARTIILDAFNARAPLRIEANTPNRSTQARLGDGRRESIAEHPLLDATERHAAAAAAFVTAARGRDLSASNARELSDAALVWERARASMAQGGAFVDVEPVVAERPKLKLIVGGGHVDASTPAPELTVIAGRRTPTPEPDLDPEPLRSA
jgi:predicted dehydrogenase